MSGGEPHAMDELRRRFELAETTVSVAGTATRLVHPRDAEALIDEEAFRRDERLPYWADLWPSARVLAELVARLDGAGRTLLELGCGIGLVSLVAARAGFAVTATDYYEDALRFAALNVREGASVTITTRLVDWRELPTDLGRFDIVVASDVLYERPYAALVAGAFAHALAPHGEGWLTDPGRIAAPTFGDEARRHGLVAERVREEAIEAEGRKQKIGVNRIVWAR